MRTALMATIGLIAWFINQGMGLLIAGAGHGWGGAFVFSLPLAVLYPLALVRAFSSEDSPAADAGLIGAATVLDLLLFSSISSPDNGYFMKVCRFDPTFVTIWLALWAGWQVPFLASLIWRTLRRKRVKSA